MPTLTSVADAATPHSSPGVLRRALRLLLACALIGASPVRADEVVQFDARWEGELVAVSASADLHVDAATAWSVLTDYDHYAEFIPDMVSSRIVSRSGNNLLVEYKGEFGFLFLRQPVQLLLQVVLDPPRRILARSVAGDLRNLNGRYDITERPQTLRIAYQAQFLPGTSFPPFIGLAVARYQMKKQFTALVNEIVRRGALAQGRKRSDAQG